jgi:hypothetical protein
MLFFPLLCAILGGSTPLMAAKKLTRLPFIDVAPKSPLQQLRDELAQNGKILGALYDTRPSAEIVRDALRREVTVVYSVEEWLRTGPAEVDLYGWDDGSLLRPSQNGQEALLAAEIATLQRDAGQRCASGRNQ